MRKPADVFDREDEWADLTDFVGSPVSELRIALVYGRRRQGKSYLLRRLADACGGFYHLATEQTETAALSRFGDALASWLDMAPGAFAFKDWEAALRFVFDEMARRTRATAGQPAVLIIDEFPYLVQKTPSLPSIIQALYDDYGPVSTSPTAPLRLILCGSAISVMSELLSGTKALRGRAALELRIKPFSFRDARRYWNISDTTTAFTHNALIGGTPGYRVVVPSATVPESPDGIGVWLARNVLRPTVPLFVEADRLIHEDPRIRDTAVYTTLLAIIAAGESSPTKIGGLAGHTSTSLNYQLTSLENSGFIERSQDLLSERRPVISVADPLMRLHHLVIEPNLVDLEAGRAPEVWHESRHTVDSKILGPHFEALAAEWTVSFARDEIGLERGATGQTLVSCKQHRTAHEVDVVALRRGVRPRTKGAGIAFLGEATCRTRPPGVAQVERLEHIRDLLAAQGYDMSACRLGLFSAAGFTSEVQRVAAGSAERVVLVSLDQIYGES